VGRLRHLTIDEGAVQRFAAELFEAPLISGPEDDALLFRGDRAACANFCLLCDALNFCFWSEGGWEVEFGGRKWTRTYAMIASILKAVAADREWLDANRWRQTTSDDVQRIFAGSGAIPLPEHRRDIMVETGEVLLDRFGGQFVNVIDGAQSHAARIADVIADAFPSFCDVAQHSGAPVSFLKRAQICVADIHRTFRGNGLDGLCGLLQLTVFADYRLPQLFRHIGAIVLTPELAATVDDEQEIEAGSPQEVELRAATIWIGDRLVRELKRLGHDIDAWELDYTLWLRARSPKVTEPHHRTLTTYY